MMSANKLMNISANTHGGSRRDMGADKYLPHDGASYASLGLHDYTTQQAFADSLPGQSKIVRIYIWLSTLFKRFCFSF
jgi:hypothetical protein